MRCASYPAMAGITVFSVLLALPSMHGQQCPDGKCRLVPPALVPAIAGTPAAPAYRWQPRTDKEVYLYQGDNLVGAWMVETRQYIPYRRGAWVAVVETPPIAPPAATPAKRFLTGVIGEKLNRAETFYTFKGLPVSKLSVYQALGSADPSKLVDDTGRWRLSLISADAGERSRFCDAFTNSADFADVRKACLWWDGPPDDWSYQCGFRTSPHQVILQKPSGEVVMRLENWTDAADVAGKVRKAIPGYDPSKDASQPPTPAPAPPPAPPTPEPPTVLPANAIPAAVAGGLGLLFFVLPLLRKLA